jgi:hypothetical protein
LTSLRVLYGQPSCATAASTSRSAVIFKSVARGHMIIAPHPIRAVCRMFQGRLVTTWYIYMPCELSDRLPFLGALA